MNDEWGTPRNLFERFRKKYRLELDVCAQVYNGKCSKFFSPEQDGLSQDWAPRRCWMNPPYSNVRPWVVKAYLESKKGALVCCLVPMSLDAQWWDWLVRDNPFCEIVYLDDKVMFTNQFGKQSEVTRFPSVVLVFHPSNGKR